MDRVCQFLDRCTTLYVMPLIEPGWQRKAACRSLTTLEADALFFVGRGGRSTKADEFCTKNQCPVRKSCYFYAVLYDEEGFWGGTSKAERDQAPPQLKKALYDEAIYYHTYENRDYESLIRSMYPNLEPLEDTGSELLESVDHVASVDHTIVTGLTEIFQRLEGLVAEVRTGTAFA